MYVTHMALYGTLGNVCQSPGLIRDTSMSLGCPYTPGLIRDTVLMFSHVNTTWLAVVYNYERDT